ncbi:hypothetical protein UFOVP309_7 [uncultured Caudovirales phage]|uniref:Uncharacterized protein n=1 Tax=uncultured Caudovirales phage TaxID=2100421 RepID=A0A6J5LU20_9CAUD|nr:hypothetical protein UFOVP309_7 [uncultured Caudovirales phage]CAB4172984.1 hypothetical protein UFOVP946_14 [uncultured Caudovirales phage]
MKYILVLIAYEFIRQKLIWLWYYLIKKGNECKKIILTTDQDLIEDGVQAIDDEFLEWFVKNPSCESVETEIVEYGFDEVPICIYKISIPKEEPKQETLEEAINNEINNIYINSSNLENIAKYNRISGTLLSELKKSMANIAKWQQERSYSEEEVMEMFHKLSMHLPLHYEMLVREMFKKK